MQKKDRIGEVNYNKQGCKMYIKEYNNHSNIIVEFENGFTKHTSYQAFQKGEVINNYHFNVVNGHGCLGNAKSKNNGKHKKSYLVWRSMLARCYDEKFHIKENTYEPCEVCEEWEYFENFEQWFDKNYYEIDNEKMCLDKDIVNKGNKIYSPQTCVFVPQTINNLFTKSDKSRGDYPIGVSYYKKYDNYVASMSIMEKGHKKHKTLGYFNTPQEAFGKYKLEKEKYIKLVAEKYKEYISNKVYNALLNYTVEITD